MADKVTLDFEKNMIIWDTDVQKGIEYCPELSTRKSDILMAMGYKKIDFTPAIKIVEAMINGQIGPAEAIQLLEKYEREGEA